MNPVLQFENVTKQYRNFWTRRGVTALDNFSLTVERGEIFGFLGPNGAGKTTAIHLAMGFMRPTKGKGMMLGHPFGHAATRRRVGFLAENVALYHRPTERLVRFYGALNGIRDPELTRRTRQVLEALNLSNHTRNVGKFSRGMVQRVGLAQALVNDPELLLLDEPASALDPIARVVVRELLLAAKAAGKTVFLSSHLLSEVEAVSDRVAIVHHGCVVRIGRINDLLESQHQMEIVARAPARLAAEFPDAATGEEGYRLTVGKAAVRESVERIWALGGEVLRVNPVRRSLEDIFLELTAENGANGATQNANQQPTESQ